MFDVVEIELVAPHRVRIMEAGIMSRDNADAFIKMAVIRRGVEKHFYAAVPSGTYKDGDLMRQEPTNG